MGLVVVYKGWPEKELKHIAGRFKVNKRAVLYTSPGSRVEFLSNINKKERNEYDSVKANRNCGK